jgi:hypothetical protein
MTSIAPEQWFPTPSTVTPPSLAPAIFAKIVRVLVAGSVDDPAANVCSKIFVQPVGVFGVPAVVVESVDSMTMSIRSPNWAAFPPVGCAAVKLVLPLP